MHASWFSFVEVIFTQARTSCCYLLPVSPQQYTRVNREQRILFITNALSTDEHSLWGKGRSWVESSRRFCPDGFPSFGTTSPRGSRRNLRRMARTPRESATDQGSAPLYSRFLVVTCATRAGSPTCQHTYMHAVICVSLLSYMYECEYSSSSWAQLELDRGI